MKTLLANLKHAARNRESVHIGGGVFTPAEIAAAVREIEEAVSVLKTLRENMSQYDDGEWYLHDGCEPKLDYIDELLGKLK